jgi:hypothetical protein
MNSLNRSRALVARNVPSQAAREAVSDGTSIAVQSPTNVRTFVNRDTVLSEYRPIIENQPAPISDRLLNFAMYLGSFGLCAFAALYSVQGLVEFFSFSPTETLAMAATMEAVKFIGVSWVAANWHTLHWWRLPLVLMLFTMAAITFIGDYVHLTQSHIGNRPDIVANLQRELADIERKITLAEKQVADADKATASQAETSKLANEAIGKLIKQGQAKAALKELKSASPAKPEQSQSPLSDLQRQRDEIKTKLAMPSKVQFLATLTGRSAETISVWLILLLTLMLDPFGLALNAAVASRR